MDSVVGRGGGQLRRRGGMRDGWICRDWRRGSGRWDWRRGIQGRIVGRRYGWIILQRGWVRMRRREIRCLSGGHWGIEGWRLRKRHRRVRWGCNWRGCKCGVWGKFDHLRRPVGKERQRMSFLDFWFLMISFINMLKTLNISLLPQTEIVWRIFWRFTTHPWSSSLFIVLFEVGWGWFSLESGISEISGIWVIWVPRYTCPELCCCSVCSGKDGRSEQYPESGNGRVVLCITIGCGMTSVESHASHDSEGKTGLNTDLKNSLVYVWILFWLLLYEIGYLYLKVPLGVVAAVSFSASPLFVLNE